MSASGATTEDEWRGAIELREDRALTELARSRLPPDGSLRAVSVTDLTGLRPAYWSAIAPVPVSAERRARFATGRAIHRAVGNALAAAGELEVRVRRDGIVGRIDVLAPSTLIEVKTTTSLVSASRLLEDRPEPVEQLAMYAALAGRERGRLLSLEIDALRARSVQAIDLSFGDQAAVLSEMADRRDQLRDAWRERRPDGLPRCRWYGRGCEFQDADVCDCTGAEPIGASPILATVRTCEDRPDVAADLQSRLGDSPIPVARIERFRDLLYLRRTYFERTGGPAESAPIVSDPSAPADLYERLRVAMESGPIGESASRPLRADDPDEEVPAFRGDPWIERVTRSWQRPTAAELADRYPQYLLELGFRCVATGATTGRLVIGWERARTEDERLGVFELHLTEPTVLARLWRERVARLERAIRAADPMALPPCPSWMASSCPYGAVCGCGDVGLRSQR